MNMLNMQFDQTELNSAPSYELLPKGNYAAQIVNSDSSELHHQPMQVRVIIKEDKTGQYEPSNEIKGFSALAQGAAAKTGGFSQPQSAAQPSQAASAPWARK